METKLTPLVDALKAKKKVCLFTGAGVSTAAGIPDFRSPDTGLYSNLAKLNLPYAEAVFDIDFFKENPKPFYTLAEELFPGKYAPTKFHYLVRLLQEKSLLKRVYTQNIDILDRLAGVRDDLIIEAHGSFATSRCIDCKKEVPIEKLKVLMKEKVPTCHHCKGYIKPDITFYGEGLPSKFFETWDKDCDDVDVAIISGTSLTVYPFASLPSSVDKSCLRVLVNREKVGDLGRRKKDTVVLSDCDEFAETLASLLGWKDELDKYYKEGQRKYGASQKPVEDELETIDRKLKEEAGVDKSDKGKDANYAKDDEDLEKMIDKLKI
ncbi:HST2 [Candida theae]|uniref:NAD-dependent protein deacetylase n=1 Tax=Candida theae TaxID=1198502 RepID=A0AAD5FXQ6_9ASCO|nr:HST2 [Candida theae]KAI5954842.1 HST2 [Candida theae]